LLFCSRTCSIKVLKKLLGCGGVVAHVNIRFPTCSSGYANCSQKAFVIKATSSKIAASGASPLHKT